jgi:membrane protein YdbS with pleckstrin-like domain
VTALRDAAGRRGDPIVGQAPHETVLFAGSFTVIVADGQADDQLSSLMAEPVARARMSLKHFAGVYIVLVIFAVAMCVVASRADAGISPAVLIAIGVGPLLLVVMYAWLLRVSTDYRIFADSLEVESGILSRRIENLQLFRVRDLGVAQSLVGRIVDVGNVTIASTDQSAPQLTLRGVPHPRQIYDTLRDLVAKSQATRRTMIVEDDTEGGGLT